MGTLGVAGFLQAEEGVRRLARGAGKQTYTVLMGKPNPAKLANFPEVEVWVMVADAQVGTPVTCKVLLLPNELFSPFTLHPNPALVSVDELAKQEQWCSHSHDNGHLHGSQGLG